MMHQIFPERGVALSKIMFRGKGGGGAAAAPAAPAPPTTSTAPEVTMAKVDTMRQAARKKGLGSTVLAGSGKNQSALGTNPLTSQAAAAPAQKSTLLGGG